MKSNTNKIRLIVESVLASPINDQTILVHATNGALTRTSISECLRLYEIFNRIEDAFKIRIPFSISISTFEELVKEVNALLCLKEKRTS